MFWHCRAGSQIFLLGVMALVLKTCSAPMHHYSSAVVLSCRVRMLSVQDSTQGWIRVDVGADI